MKFNCDRATFAALTQKAAKIAPRNHPIEILVGILVEADMERQEIFLTTTDMATSVMLKMKATISEGGKTVIAADLLSKISVSWDNERIFFQSHNDSAIGISNGTEKSRFNILTKPAKYFKVPAMPFPEETVKIKGICTLAKKTTYAASKDETNPVLSCVNLRLATSGTTISASNRANMVVQKINLTAEDEMEFLIPASTLELLAAISTDEMVYEIGSVDDSIVFTGSDIVFSARSVKGKFIDCDRVIKAIEQQYAAVVDAKSFARELDSIKVFSPNARFSMILTESEVLLEYNDNNGYFKSQVKAKTIAPTGPKGFHYPIAQVLNFVKRADGLIKIVMDKQGFMLMVTKEGTIIFVSPMVEKKNKETSEKTKKSAA
ncbi:hypothetical protein LJB89_00460 [Tyzzerella sp. OttesenSCG-928-J15]|nr:hypothetical protein [Tyzzerella sp. OttesenSCG-928-J15]